MSGATNRKYPLTQDYGYSELSFQAEWHKKSGYFKTVTA